VGSGRALTLFFAVQTFGSIKCGTAFQNNCTEQNAMKIGEHFAIVSLNWIHD